MIVTYDLTLVLLSISVAIIGSYTGLRLMAPRGGFSRVSYKIKIAAGAIAIGSSIWSMHFIAMLALGLPIPVEYDALVTTISVFVAILLTGLGLYAASSGHLARWALPVGGLLMGGGIAGMHYLGMSAIRAGCLVSYQPLGVVGAVAIGMAASTLALWFSLRERGSWETALGAVALGLAIASMHYVAMTATDFMAGIEAALPEKAALTPRNLAFVVAITTFLICGLFLVLALPDQKRAQDLSAKQSPADAPPADLASTTQAPDEPTPSPEEPALAPMPSPVPDTPPPAAEAPSPAAPAFRIPVRRNQSVFYAEPWAISAVRADGHYSRISVTSAAGDIEEYFCESSISALAKLLDGRQFVRSHRSHIVNIEHVHGFRRQGDGGLLLMNAHGAVSVPVSRSNIRQVLRLLERRQARATPPPETTPFPAAATV